MRHKRISAAEARSAAKATAAGVARPVATFGTVSNQATAPAARARATTMAAHVEEVVPFLQRLGYRNHDARSAASLCESMADASLEDRVREALKYFRVRGTKLAPVVAPGSAGYAAGGSVVTGA